MNPVVKVDNLSVFYEQHQAIKNIRFQAGPGQMIGILGPNGAGKSTLMKAILGLERYTGTVKVLDKHVRHVRKQIAYVPQRNAIDWDFPVLVEDVVMMGRFAHIPWFKRAGKNDKRLVEESLKKVGMEEYRSRQIGELSGGQQQRVFIARALAQESELFFLDEPFVGIDVTSESIILSLLQELRDRGKTIFVVHHDLSKVEKYFDQVLMLNKELIAYGPVADVYTPEMVAKTYQGNLATFSKKDEVMVVNV
ncbi:metal ABC transporter ATP-binding protein [Halalkalibacterium halodurans]|uniref:Manganese transport system ATP-binding protein MntB n=2 Tax=Halalkalibacterium halodurans TaxID=86665 RepID=MNTB_HALH5|nr:metal ABC transporter ATP-binding protein [Halalkalibacterium halodurans]Q9KD30.1 RecName: Full=Manganese transport system ATP-binding protein MntB [Halalkalibacterium halodurans C-125]MED4081781.1 metal ABC transporter ATP-binding protein [Halalkalibacterium halodurans]MED4087049.1 metal ABC transporter ATP-binding protein [Halalkalibacterium halodurans]MED4103868.1 metal ABC transporter ATP-binding protein [Halalkalibacterium halodurans]MED4110876.1 metal ABC transporter ATP-binding prote